MIHFEHDQNKCLCGQRDSKQQNIDKRIIEILLKHLEGAQCEGPVVIAVSYGAEQLNQIFEQQSQTNLIAYNWNWQHRNQTEIQQKVTINEIKLTEAILVFCGELNQSQVLCLTLMAWKAKKNIFIPINPIRQYTLSLQRIQQSFTAKNVVFLITGGQEYMQVAREMKMKFKDLKTITIITFKSNLEAFMLDNYPTADIFVHFACPCSLFPHFTFDSSIHTPFVTPSEWLQAMEQCKLQGVDENSDEEFNNQIENESDQKKGSEKSVYSCYKNKPLAMADKILLKRFIDKTLLSKKQAEEFLILSGNDIECAMELMQNELGSINHGKVLSEKKIIILENQEQFLNILQKGGSQLIVVYFSACWCQPCSSLSNIVRSLPARYPNATILSCDIDAVNDLDELDDIKAIPAFMFFKDGKRAEYFTGDSEDYLLDTIEKYI
ncbi:MAG: hypothetical protein EZS28_000364 [Streblomastix strix]|uniref:Thioredoxin domain-containing protein n=1 Tax=Streblomastix strix TaxID=222440 RepID=A0A5J4XAF5_9EUKA|nr:MAG: hypothetical protein EZS28_000364 [Streblomastix strix]